MRSDLGTLTELLRQSRAGDRAAFDQVMRLVYTELRRQAAKYLYRGTPSNTLQPTALVHEAYLRMSGRSQPDWQDRAHFFSVAARVMRQILVDHVRAKYAAKRGGAQFRLEFKDSLNYSTSQPENLLIINDALDGLAAFDPRKARVLELHYFCGLRMEEITEALGLSPATVRRDMRFGEAWLRRELERQ